MWPSFGAFAWAGALTERSGDTDKQSVLLNWCFEPSEKNRFAGQATLNPKPHSPSPGFRKGQPIAVIKALVHWLYV